MVVVMIGPFGLRRKGTVVARALPMARALAARGYLVTLFLPAWDSPEDAGQSWEEDRVRIENSPPLSPLPLLCHLFMTLWLVRRALALHPDVVHCFKPKAYAGLAAFCLWWLKRFGLGNARIVVDSDDWEGAGGWNDLENYSTVQKYFFAWQEKWGLTHADSLIVASRALQTIAWSLGVKPDTVFYVPNGAGYRETRESAGWKTARQPTDLPMYLQGKRDRPVVLLYTRFFEFHIERVVEIWRMVLRDLPEARLLVVGQGLFGEEERLTRLMEGNRQAGQVIFAGWIDAVELPGYFAMADVAIYPYDDTLVNRTKCAVKLVDLLAAGLPVVANAVGQNSEYIEHQVSGWLVPPGDDEAFAAAVVHLLKNEELRSRLAREASHRALTQFSWAQLIERVEHAYAGDGFKRRR
jgi:glycosyltransferase involved in cell wall biosynthesis